MSIQFRSRIKPAIDYSNILTNYGYCCNPSDLQNPVKKTFVECITEGGYFVQGASGQQVTCPEADTELGCCCSCSYVNDTDYNLIEAYPPTTPYLTSGTRSQVTRCECARLGGKFTPTVDGNCPSLTNDNWETYCKSTHPTDITKFIDIRSPRSCCYLEFDTNTGWPTGVVCGEVCTSADCALLSTETYPSVFNDTLRCTTTLNSADTQTAQCASPNNLALIANLKLYQGFEMGSCYELVNNNGTYEYECSITPESICTGHWIESQDENNAFCKNAKEPTNPQKSGSIYLSQSMGLSAFNALGLTSGDNYQGGVFIGIYKPSPISGKSSEILGNINFGNPSNYRFVADSIGGTAEQWAIIVDETLYALEFLSEDEKDVNYPTSLWDGYYNTYGNNSNFLGIKTNITNSIAYVPKNGFLDYYIPSIYELGFYAKYLESKNITNKGNLISSSIFNTKNVGSNYSKTTFNNQSFVYGQAIKTSYDVNYKNILINKRDKENMVFFRRILLT